MSMHWIEKEGHDDIQSLIMDLVIELDSLETIIKFDNEGEPDAVKAVMIKYSNGATGLKLLEVEEEDNE